MTLLFATGSGFDLNWLGKSFENLCGDIRTHDCSEGAACVLGIALEYHFQGSGQGVINQSTERKIYGLWSWFVFFFFFFVLYSAIILIFWVNRVWDWQWGERARTHLVGRGHVSSGETASREEGR